MMGSSDMALAIRQARSEDGTTIAGEIAGTGAPMLLVHGTSSGRGRWGPILPALSDRFELCLMDRRGRGLSSDTEPHSLEAEISDVVALAHETGARALVAHSYGAICALEASTQIKGLEALVLYEAPVPVPPFDVNPVDVENIRRVGAFVEAGEPEQALLTFMRDILRMPATQIEAAKAQRGWQERLDMAHTLSRELAAARKYRFDATRFAALDIPVLLLLGGDSPQRYIDATTLVADGMPRGELRQLPGQRHNAITEAPDLFAREVRAFLETCL
jgi:pimeloyl-ACP methyl ester carboxylesterase